jgi:hypothetical protein
MSGDDAARSRHDLRQFDDLVHALDAILHRDLKDWMFYPQSRFFRIFSF